MHFNQDNPAILTATHAQNLLLYAHIGSAIMMATHVQNFLLLCLQDNPAITMATYANSKLNLIILSTLSALIKLIVDFIPVSEGAQQVICNNSVKLIVESFSDGASQPINWAQQCNLTHFGNYIKHVGILSNSEGVQKAQNHSSQLIVDSIVHISSKPS